MKPTLTARLSGLVGGPVTLTLLDQSMVSGINFSTAVILARALGPDRFGAFTLCWMTVLFSGGVQMALVLAPAMSIGPKLRGEELEEYLTVTHLLDLILLGGVGVLVFAGVSLAGAYRYQPTLSEAALALSCACVAFQLQDYVRRVFYILQRIRLALLCDAVSYLGQLVALLVLWRVDELDLVPVLWVFTASSGFAVLVMLPFFPPLRFRRTAVRSVSARGWKMGRWLLPSTLLEWGTSALFLLAATSVLGARTVGLFRASQNLASVSNLVFQAAGNLVPVRLAQTYGSGGWRGLAASTREHAIAILGATSLISLPLLIAPTACLTMLYGSDYAVHPEILIVAAIASLAFGLNLCLSWCLAAVEESRPRLLAQVASGLVMLIGVVPMLRAFGLHGWLTLSILTAGIRTAILALGYLAARRRHRGVEQAEP